MSNDITNIQLTTDLHQAVSEIKRAIVVSQSRALRMISGEQLSLYFRERCQDSEASPPNPYATCAPLPNIGRNT